ncbi:MAG: hypothetical protein WCS30_11745 [Selenomonadaceae bacterium]
MLDNYIHVSGARERNLKNIHIKIPKKKLLFLLAYLVRENHH